jgi:hypothetical protein
MFSVCERERKEKRMSVRGERGSGGERGSEGERVTEGGGVREGV